MQTLGVAPPQEAERTEPDRSAWLRYRFAILAAAVGGSVGSWLDAQNDQPLMDLLRRLPGNQEGWAPSQFALMTVVVCAVLVPLSTRHRSLDRPRVAVASVVGGASLGWLVAASIFIGRKGLHPHGADQAVVWLVVGVLIGLATAFMQQRRFARGFLLGGAFGFAVHAAWAVLAAVWSYSPTGASNPLSKSLIQASPGGDVTTIVDGGAIAAMTALILVTGSRPIAAPSRPAKARIPGTEANAGTALAPVNGFAITSLVFGILSGSLFAIVFGHIALHQIKQSGGMQRGRGIALAGTILGYLWLVLTVASVVAIRLLLAST